MSNTAPTTYRLTRALAMVARAKTDPAVAGALAAWEAEARNLGATEAQIESAR
ncbi:hypothetical protein [Prescottella equi]|uniref:hypothetical protein n=1 Tax=Rhodococcus hoagii TaxID=43767 RepID=UPI00131B6358|nr:hypothetical protein [Prescottella equi]